MSTEQYDLSFEIIAFSGNASSAAMMAIVAAREGRFDQAKENLSEAEADYLKAHQMQSDLLSKMMSSETAFPVDLLMAHAQDHLTMATMNMSYAQEFICLYERLARLEEKN